MTARVSNRTVADTCSSLRSFLRFLHLTGRSRTDLARTVSSPRIGFAEHPPRALPWRDVRRIFRTIDQSKPPGKRDFAMLLLMATYGMGAAEALSLEIDDFNWKLKTLRVRRSKTAVVIELPLLPIVARAVIAYLKAERPPAANTRQILLRTSMPYGSMTSSAIRHRIRFPVVHEQ